MMSIYISFIRISLVFSVLLGVGCLGETQIIEPPQSNAAPPSMIALSEVGRRADASMDLLLDTAFWDAMSVKGGGSSRIDERAPAYVAVMRLAECYASGRNGIDTDHIISVFNAVLDWGLLSDYLAVSGGLNRIVSRAGKDALADERWQYLVGRLADVMPFFRNEIRQVGVPETVGLKLGEVYASLFSSGSLDEFNHNTLKLDEEMSRKLASEDDQIAYWYFKGPSLSKIAILVYKNRSRVEDVRPLKSEPPEPTKAR